MQDGIGVSSNDCISCLVDEIKSKLGNVNAPENQLNDGLKSSTSVNEFLYKSLLPLKCLSENQVVTAPPFVAKSFPTDRNDSSVPALENKIEELLKSNQSIKNGISWQNSNGNGWVELETLIKGSRKYRTFNNISGIERPEQYLWQSRFISRNKMPHE